MDDIKQYAKNERDIDSLIHLTRIYSQDAGMSFGLEKCGRMIVRKSREGGFEQPGGHKADIQDNYRYLLGILQSHGNHDEEARKTATAKKLHKPQSVP